MGSIVQSDEASNRIPWPPILFVATIAFGLLLNRLAPVSLTPRLQGVGAVLVALALLSDIWCARELWRHRTTIQPHRAVSTLVTTGPYRWSRNPIYVSHIVLTAALGLLLGNLWILLLTPVMICGRAQLSIAPEEAYLARKFGAAFADYAARTRRWA
jgi:protein-S-isoprenylcysteine O-methyltransferase Ste14